MSFRRCRTCELERHTHKEAYFLLENKDCFETGVIIGRALRLLISNVWTSLCFRRNCEPILGVTPFYLVNGVCSVDVIQKCSTLFFLDDQPRTTPTRRFCRPKKHTPRDRLHNDINNSRSTSFTKRYSISLLAPFYFDRITPCSFDLTNTLTLLTLLILLVILTVLTPCYFVRTSTLSFWPR